MSKTSNMSKFFKGLYTAIPTPFIEEISDNGAKIISIDYEALDRIIDLQINASVDGIVVAGSTGEASTLTDKEYFQLLEYVAKKYASKINLISGIGSTSTDKSLELCKISEKLGYYAVMAVTPYYNKPTQEGLIAHYKKIHDNSNIPIMLYSVPGRTGIDINDETIIELSKFDRVLGIKDASANVTRSLSLNHKVKNEFSILSGDDVLALAYNVNGASGLVSVTSNILPKICKKIQDLSLSGNFKESLNLHVNLLDLYKFLFIESNPSPVKYALSKINICSDLVRLPLVGLKPENKRKIDEIMSKFL